MIELLKCLIIHVSIIVLILCGVYAIKKSSCITYGKITEMETDFYFVGGCFVKINGKWVHRDKIREEL